MDVSTEAQEGQQLSQYTVGLLVDLSKGDEDEDVDIDEEDVEVDGGILKQERFKGGALEGPALAGEGQATWNVEAAASAKVVTNSPGQLGGLQNRRSPDNVDKDIDAKIFIESQLQRRTASKEHVAESQASIGQSPQSLDLDKSLSDENAEVAALEPLENPQMSIPEVDMEENSSLRRPKARDFREHLSKKFRKVRTLPTMSRESTGLSRGDSKEASVRRSNGNLDGSRGKEVQTGPKRKAVEIEPSPSARIKRGKMNADFIPWSAVLHRKSKEDAKAKNATLDRTVESPSKRKERLKDTESLGRDKTQKVAGKEGEKLRRSALIDDDVEDEESEQEEPQWRASRKSDGKGKKISGVKASPQDFEQKEAGIVESEAHKGSESGESQDTLEEQQQSAEVGADVAFRSKFGTKDKRKPAHHMSNGRGAVALAGNSTQTRDEMTRFKWITCTECKKMRKIPADARVRKLSWSCEKNVWDSQHSSCSAPQEKGAPSDEQEITDKSDVPESQYLAETSTKMDQGDGGNPFLAHLNLVWLKVDEEDLWWPAKIVTESEVPQDFAKEVLTVKDSKKKIVSLFHPPKDLEPFQVVKRSCMRPFEQFYENFKSSNRSPEFKRAVSEAYRLFRMHACVVNEAIAAPATVLSEGGNSTAGGKGDQNSEEVSLKEEAQMNEIVVGDAQTLEADTVELEKPAEEEVTQGKVRKKRKSKEVLELTKVNDLKDTSEKSQELASGEAGKKENPKEISGLTKATAIADISDKARQVTTSEIRKKRKSKGVLGPTNLTDSTDVNEPTNEVSPSEAGTLPKAKEVLDKPFFSESEKTRASVDRDVGEELPVQIEKLVLDLEILPKKRIVAYDVSLKELEFQDGFVLKIDTKALGQALNKSSCGLTPYQCIQQAGKENIRKRFPRDGKSSNGLDFEFLDQKSDFATRLRETWGREYPEEEFPKFLKTRFVAACVMEEKGETVNWAADLARELSLELRAIAREHRSEMSATYLNVISQLLRKQSQMSSQVSESSSPRVLDLPEEVDMSAPRVEEIVPVEDKVDLTEYNHCCQQCTCGGELLCCDGSDCRKTYHLKCLDPPLKEVPTSSFFCPSCSQGTPQSPAATLVLPTYKGNVGMEHADGATRAKASDEAEVPAESMETRSEPGVAESAIPMEEDSIKEVVHEISTEEVPHTSIAEENGPEGQPNKIQFGKVILHPEKFLTTKESQKLQPGEEIAVDNMSDEIANGKNASIEEQPKDCNDQRGTGKDVQVGSLPGRISPRDSGATFSSIQLVNRDERSGSRGETNLLSVFTDSGLLPSRAINEEPVESELEEGEIAPQQQGGLSVTAEKGKTITSGDAPSNHPAPMVFPELHVTSTVPQEDEGEFPSSDDHNSICEECEVGGELMLCDGKGCKVVYHKECLEPPLREVPAGEWFCPQCEMKRKGGIVEKIWAVREGATEPLSNGMPDHKTAEENRKSDTSSPEQMEEDQFDSDDEGSGGLQDMPLNTRFKKAPQPEVEELGFKLSRRGGQAGPVSEKTHIKDKGPEYLVQWRSRAHAHNTWVPEKELEKLAPKDLARYKKMLAQGQVDKWNPDWAQPQRVIQKRLIKIPTREPDGEKNRNSAPLSRVHGVEWYVKWKGLGYEHCTWEPVDTGVLSTRRATKLFSAFEKWTEAAKQRATPQSAEQAERHCKAPLKRLESQPSWVSPGELLPVQLDALNQLRVWWHNRSNGILVYEASQEKIVTTIVFFLSLVEEFRVVHPILVVVPVGLVPTWERELQLWAPKLNMVNYASKIEDARDVVQRMEFSLPNGHFKPQIVLTTFEVINCDMDHLKKLDWEALIIDEGRRLRPQKTYRPFSQLKSVFRLLLLSEPLKANVEELSQFVGFLEPRKTLLMHGDEATQVAELQRRLSGRVREYMPSNRLTEFWVPVEMTPVHLNQYYEILVKNYPTLSRNRRDHQIQEVVMKLRQSCNHPFLAEPGLEGTLGQGLTAKELLDAHIQMSGKMQLVHLMMPILKSAVRRVLIFSQETKQLDILERYMTQSHGTNSYERVDSDLAIKAKEAAIQRFNAEGSDRFVFLLKTGAHISLRNVHLEIIYDSDWNPTNDTRALKKVHIEGEPGSSPLAVFRLYTHLSVEESMLILSRDKQMPMGRTTVSAKVCQKHLTWGASKICELHDKDALAAGESQHRPKGAKICPKAKTKRIIYSAEKVQKLLDGAFSQEESAKPELDDLLQEVLIPRDETAPLFAENEGHPIDMDTGGSAEAFWTSFFKWRHEEWQAKEVNMLGKGQRGRKRVTYDEDALASAAYTKAQMADEIDKKRTRRRRSSSEEGVVEQSIPETIPGQEISFATPNILFNVMTTGQATESETQRSQSQTVKVSSAVEKQKKDLEHSGGPNDVSNQTVVERTNMPASATQSMVSLPAAVECAVPTITTAHEEKEITGSRLGGRAEYFLQLESLLARICRTLELSEQIEERALDLFRHVTTTSKILKRRLEIHESIALELILCWVAADQLLCPMDKRASADKLAREFSVNNDRVQLEGPLLERVQGICSSFQKRPPFRVATVTAQSTSVSESSMRNSRIAEQGLPKSSIHLSTESIQPVMPCQAQVVDRPTTGGSVECSTPYLILSSPQVPSVQKVHINESAGQLDDPEIARPYIEVQLVEGEPRFVSEGQVNILTTGIQPVTPATPQLPLTIISSNATVELGLGWVTHEVTPQVQPAEELDIATQVDSLSVESTPASQLWNEVVVAGVGPPQAAVDQTETDSVVVRVPEMASVSAPVLASPEAPTGPQAAPKQVLSGGAAQMTKPHVQARSDTAAQLATKLREDRALVIRAQTEEMGQFNQRLDREGNELKDQFDKACRVLRTTHDTPGPMIESRKALHDIDVRALDRRRKEEHKAMEARQRNDRDKLTELYRRQIDQVQRTDSIPPDVSTLVSQMNTIKQFYSKFLAPPSPQARPQEPTWTYVPPQPTGTSSLQSPSMRGQPDGRSSVSQSLSPAQIAELRQRLHPLLGPRTVPASASPVQASSTPLQQRAHPVRNMPGHGVGQMAAGQRPPTQSSTEMGQVAGQPSIDQFQRPHAVGTTTSIFNMPRVSSMSRGPFMSTVSGGVPTIAPAVATSSRIPLTAPAGPGPNAQSPAYVYPDVLLKEKEKLSKELEKAKLLYEAESQRIKAEYDKEAEALHKKYETLLVEEHRAFTTRQHQVQQNIIKVDWNRQLAEALKLREELASRAGMLTAAPPPTNSSMTAQPYLRVQQPQPNQSSARPMQGVPLMTPTAILQPSRGNMHNNGQFLSAGTQGMMTGYSVIQASSRIPTAPTNQPSPISRVETATPLNQQPRAPLSQTAHAVVAEAVQRGIGLPPGTTVAGTSMPPPSSPHPVQRPRIPSMSVPAQETNAESNPSPRQQTTGTSTSVLGGTSVSAPSFSDPILSVIRNSLPPTMSSFAGVSSTSPRDASATGAVASMSASPSSLVHEESSLPETSVTGNQTQVAGPEPSNSVDLPSLISPRGHTSPAEGVPIEVLTSDPATISETGIQTRAARAPVRERPASVIYLSDSDDD